MSETTQSAKGWEGKVVDGTLPLLRLLGETDHSAVFLTEYLDGQAKKKAAIKLISAQHTNADLQLANWNFAAHMTHPNLLQLFRCGRCSVDGHDLLFVVMEHAEENLADILTQRALTGDETRDMLLPVLDALEFLHVKGLVHRAIKPSNILASGDQLKLSSDAVTRVGEGFSVPRKASVYDPPEAISGVLSPAGDAWALGTTLVEVLTQKVPELQSGSHREPVVPANLTMPFLEIARQCLRLEPDRRMRIADVAARLNPRAAAAAAAATPRMPAASVPPPPPAAPPAPKMVGSATVAAPAKPAFSEPPVRKPTTTPNIPASVAREAAQATRSGPGYVIPLLVVAAIVFAVVIAVPRLVPHKPEVASSRSAAAPTGTPPDAAKHEPASGVTAGKADAKQKADAASRQAVRAAAAGDAAAVDATPKPGSDGASTDSLKTTSEKAPATDVAADSSVAPAVPAKPSVAPRAGKGEVLDQVLPDVPQKARDTIHGSVRVSVNVHVDAAGAVSGADLDSAGPSKFFADWALQAAKRWAFTPPEVAGKSVPSEWTLRFVFTPTDTKVTPKQTAP